MHVFPFWSTLKIFKSLRYAKGQNTSKYVETHWCGHGLNPETLLDLFIKKKKSKLIWIV